MFSDVNIGRLIFTFLNYVNKLLRLFSEEVND